MLKETKEVFKQLGCEKIVESVEHGFCPGCSLPVSKEEFKDMESEAEYAISGLCQKCQDQIFTEEVCKAFPKGRYPDRPVKIILQ